MSEFKEPKDVEGFIEITGAEQTYWIDRVTFKELLLKVAEDYAESLGNRDTAARTLNAFAEEHGITDHVAHEALVAEAFPAILVWFEEARQKPKTLQRAWFRMAYRSFMFELHAEGRRDA